MKSAVKFLGDFLSHTKIKYKNIKSFNHTRNFLKLILYFPL